jgi:hypothetical protein
MITRKFAGEFWRTDRYSSTPAILIGGVPTPLDVPRSLLKLLSNFVI